MGGYFAAVYYTYCKYRILVLSDGQVVQGHILPGRMWRGHEGRFHGRQSAVCPLSVAGRLPAVATGNGDGGGIDSVADGAMRGCPPGETIFTTVQQKKTQLHTYMCVCV